MSRVAVAMFCVGAAVLSSASANALTRPRDGTAPAWGRAPRATKCNTGIAGSMAKDQCAPTAKYTSTIESMDASEPNPGCWARQYYSNACRENDSGAGGDDDCTAAATKEDCEAVPGGPNDESRPTIDGSDRKCFWFPARDDASFGDLCGSARSPHFDDKCYARSNSGGGTCSGEMNDAAKDAMSGSTVCADRHSDDSCTKYWADGAQVLTGCTWEPTFTSWDDVQCQEKQESTNAQASFRSMLGTDCKNRLRNGCREAGDDRGGGKGCTDFSDETSCLGHGDSVDDWCPGTCTLASGDSLHPAIGSADSFRDGKSCADQTAHQSMESCEYFTPSCHHFNSNQTGCENVPGCNYDIDTGMCNEAVSCYDMSDPAECASTEGCTYRHGSCTKAQVATGCTYKKQCCQWIPPIGNSDSEKEDACNTSGAGTEAGLCEIDPADGSELPSPSLIAMGFEYSLFQSGPDTFSASTGCAMIATFVDGKGAGVVLGADRANLMGKTCNSDKDITSDFCEDEDATKQGIEPWKCVREHVDMTTEEIDSYCDNFAGVGNTAAKQAFAKYTVNQLIHMANKGTLGDAVEAWRDLKYIVARRDGIDGRCLLIGPKDQSYGVAACTCDSAECNDADAIGALVDAANGPMRLFQFLDGSLGSLKDEINAAVPGILGSDGSINMDKVSDVTPGDIAKIMAVSGVSDLTNAEELQGLINDFKAMADGSNLDSSVQFNDDSNNDNDGAATQPPVVVGTAGTGEASLSLSIVANTDELSTEQKDQAIDSAITELTETGATDSSFIDRSKCSVVKDTARRRESTWKIIIVFNVDLSDEAITQLETVTDAAIQDGTFVIAVSGVEITVTAVEASNDEVPTASSARDLRPGMLALALALATFAMF